MDAPPGPGWGKFGFVLRMGYKFGALRTSGTSPVGFFCYAGQAAMNQAGANVGRTQAETQLLTNEDARRQQDGIPGWMPGTPGFQLSTPFSGVSP